MRDALSAALATAGFSVVAAFPCGEQAAGALATLAVDAALVDLGLPGFEGAAIVARLLAVRPEVPILVLTVFERRDVILEALRAGAQGYLLKGASIDDVARALHDVMSGASPLSPAIARHLVDVVRRNVARAESVVLTPRERELLALFVDGHSYESASSALGIRLGTVQSHVKSLYRKLEVSSKSEAVATALRGVVRGGGE